MARHLLGVLLLSMKSTRMRFETPQTQLPGSCAEIRRESLLSRGGPVCLAEMPPPATIERISPDQVIVDVLVATLLKVQRSATPEVAAAAERYLAQLR